jgi:hypothetical protein
MRSIVRLLLPLLLAPAALFCQTPEDYFHNAAKQFIFADDGACKAILDEGLRKYPDDPKLNALKKKIKENKKQDQDQKQSQDQKNKDQKDKNKQDKNQDQKKEDQKQQNAQGENKEEQKPPQDQNPQPKKAGALSEEEAKRLMDALKQDETDMQKKLMRMKIPTKKLEKDW